MSSEMKPPSRRGFLKGGAIVAAPFALSAPAALAGDKAQLAAEDAIRLAHQAWMAAHNRGTAAVSLDGVRSLTTDPKGAAEVITLAKDGKSATLTMAAIVETASDLPRDCTLAKMAHAQGTGTLCESAQRVLTTGFVKGKEGWSLTEATCV